MMTQISKLFLIGAVATIFSFTHFGNAAKAKVATNPDNPVLGSAKAASGGTFYMSLPKEPSKLNPITSSDYYASQVQAYVVDSLMIRNPETYKFQPALAKSVVMADDGLTVTVTLREGAKFHDGKPVTAEDVKFSFDVIMDKRFDTAHLRPYYENIESATISGKNTIVFKIKNKYFNNYNVVAGLEVLPKHKYSDPKKKLNKTIHASGPYKIDRYQKGKSLILKKNKDWWGFSDPLYKNAFKYDKVFIRFIKEDNVRLEMLKKGQIDYYPRMTPEQYVKKAVGKLWGSKVHKKKVENLTPKPYAFIGWNFKSDLFQQKKVRLALAHLFNRELMIKKFRYDMSLPATGPWYQQSPFASKKVKPLEYNPKLAFKLLREAGWKDSDKDGVLDKVIKGKKTNFKFTLKNSNKDREKYFTLYKEDLKKAGIHMDIQTVEWNTFIKALDDKKFEAVSLGWGGGGIENDPKQIWHTDSAKNKGSNFISYSNKKVDKLIDDGRKILGFDDRIATWNKIYELIASDAPYLFLFNDKYVFYSHTDRLEMEKPTYAYGIDTSYFWIKK